MQLKKPLINGKLITYEVVLNRSSLVNFIDDHVLLYGMPRFKITHVRKDSNEVITQVKIGSSTFDVETVAKWIDKEGDYVYTMKNGKEAPVYARKHSRTHRWFLTTRPDGMLENNLDFLPTF